MSRTLEQVIEHIRAVSANPAISTTLIQTEELEALCDAAEDTHPETKVTADQPVYVIEFSKAGIFARKHEPGITTLLPPDEAMAILQRMAAAHGA